MNATPVTEALIILTQADYLHLKQDLKAAGQGEAASTAAIALLA